MRKVVFLALRFFKWQIMVPVFWYLGLPRSWLIDRFRLAPYLPNSTEKLAHRSSGGAESDENESESRYPEPARASIYSAAMVAETIRVLGRTSGQECMVAYLRGLIDAAPQHVADIRWGENLVLRDRNPQCALHRALELYRTYPLVRFRGSLLQMLNQAGSVHRARVVAEEMAKDDPAIERTVSLLKARERLLERGFVLPLRTGASHYRPVPKRAFYLLHNSLPYNSGGYATRTHGLVRSLRAHGWEVECVTRLGYPSDISVTSEWIPPVDHVDGVPYRRLKDRSGAYRKVDSERYLQLNSEAVLQLAQKRKPALIHAASNHINGMAAAYVGRKLNIPSIYEVRGLWELTRMSRQPDFEGSELYEMIVRLETQACLEVDHVIAITDALKQLLIERGIPGSKIRVIPNGVDVVRFSAPAEDPSTIRSKWRIPTEAMVLGYVGSMPQYEGLVDLVDAMTRINPKLGPLVHCLIVGDGDEFGNLKQFTAEHGVGDRVHFAGRVPHDEVEQYYAAIDVVVFPRRPQPVTEIVSPMKPFEAMAMGKAVLASDVEALAEIVADGRTGLLFKKGNISSLTERIEVLAHDPDYRAQLGAEGKRWVSENRDWQHLSLDIVSDYKRLLENYTELKASEEA